MGLLKNILGAAAPIVGSMIPGVGPALGSAIGGAVGGLLNGGGKSTTNVTDTTQAKIDPRMDAMLWGSNGTNGLLSQFQGMLNTPRSSAATGFANTGADYLNSYGSSDLDAARQAALKAMGGNSAPTAAGVQSGATGSGLNAYAVGNMVQAPSQNNINLTPTFQNLLGGGDTSKLMASLDSGNQLAGAQFRQNQSDLTDNLQRNIMPGIRSNSVLAGQYGGSRQGVAEGLAISDLTKQLNNSNTQFGLGATAASSSALANAYENGQNRSLAAAQGLSGQQYATAFQNANTKNQAEFMNVGNVYDLGKFNAGLQQQNNQFNAGQAQQNNQFNAGMQFNTNSHNISAGLNGAGLLNGLLGQASGVVNANDNYALDRASQVNGLLQPYISLNGTRTETTPYTQNKTPGLAGVGGLIGSMLGGGSSSLPSLQTNYAQPITATAQPNSMPISLPFMSRI